jgi:peptidoglycan/LPS O-acetylase OafA/YrhL
MIPGLDGLRAVAYLLIFALHARFFAFGWVGVQFFFVLSGFLITGILLDMKQSLPTAGYFVKFYGRRFLRIFPLYYLYLFLMLGITTWLISIRYRPSYMETTPEQVRYAFLYGYNFMLATVKHEPAFYLEHLWSLSLEEQFYVIWPLLILLLPQKHLKGFFLSLIVLGPLFRVAFTLVHATGEFRIFHPNVAEALYPLPFTHVDAFAFGAFISRYKIPRAREQFFLLAGAVPLIGFAAQYFATGSIGDISALGYPLLMAQGGQYIWGYSLLNYFFAVIIQAVASQGLFNRFLEWAPMRYLGKISYGLYIYHQPILWFAFDIRELGVDPNLVQPLAAMIGFFGTLLVASLSYHFFEKPILNLKDRYLPMKTGRHP